MVKLNIDFDQMNARLRKRLDQLRQHQDPAERLRLLKRYLSHFVKLVQAGRHFEISFGEHLRLVVLYLNDRREQPLEEETLGTIVKTLCVICCISCVSHQAVMIALHGMLDIFERISCKETLTTIEYCGNHFKKLIAQFKRFGYYKIQRQLVELVYITSLSFTKPKERKDFVLELGKLIGGHWEKVLRWKSIAVEKEVRTFINDLQDRYPMFSAYSVPVEDCRIGEYRLEQPKESNGLWLDVNFKPATVRLAGCVTLVRGTNRLEMNVGLEIDHRNVSKIYLENENDKHLLFIEYEEITFEPEVLKVEAKGSLILTVSPAFDCGYLVKEVIPEVRLKVQHQDSEQPNTMNLEGLLNVSLLESVASGPANSHHFDQSPRLRDNRDAIEQHRNMRCQMLDTASSAGSNKENVEPRPSVSDVRVALQDIQRLRVFEPLQQECQQRRLSRGVKPSSPGKRNQREETVVPHINDGKKRKLFDKQAAVPDVLNDSVDSQLQRNKYVEKKLVNTVKPIQTLDVKQLASVPAADHFKDITDELNESSATDNMSSEEFEQSLQAYIDNNGIFGIAQKKVMNKNLEKNIRKINQMVDRSTKKFFKREPAADNPYDFIDSEGNRKPAKKQASRKGTNSASKRKPKTNNENTLPKASKNAANQSIRNKNSKSAKKDQNESTPKPVDPIPLRASLPRSKKPIQIIDLSSDSENEGAVEIGNTFQNLDISSIAAAVASDAKSKPRIPIAKQLFAKSTPVENARSKKRPLNRTYAVDVSSTEQGNPLEGDRAGASPVKKQRVPLLEVETEGGNNNYVFVRCEYKKQQPPTEMQQRVSALLERDQEQEAPSPTPSLASSHSDDTQISMQIPRANEQSLNEHQERSALTKAVLVKYRNSISETSIPQSLEVEVNASPPSTAPVQEANPKPSVEPSASNFNMNYAKSRYTLKKFISNNDETFVEDEEAPAHLDNHSPNDGNQTILSDEIRVSSVNAVPPSLPDDDDSSDLQFVGNESLELPQRYPTTPQSVPSRKDSVDPKPVNDPEARDKNPSQTVNSGGGNRTRTQETIVPNNSSRAKSTLNTLMLDKFQARTHEEFNPSLAELESKVEKLDNTMQSFQGHLSNIRNEEFGRKCEEIIELENQLDEKHKELVKLSLDNLERFDQAFATSKKLVRYFETKVNYFKQQIQSARREMPSIVDETIKSVWNEQVRVRLDQMELLMAKMLM